MTIIEKSLDLLGSTLQVAGAFVMAKNYLAVRKREIPLWLIRSFGSGDREQQLASLMKAVEKPINMVRGLALTAIGFLLEAVAKVLEILA